MFAWLVCGCGGGGGPAPALGSGLTTHVRGLDLVQNSPQITVQAGPFGNPVGTIGSFQATAYASESGGSSGIRFFDSNGTLSTFNGTLLASTFNTVAVYSTASGFATFGLQDNPGPATGGSIQIRIVDAASILAGDVDVYLSPGAHSLPVTVAQDLLTPNGISLGQTTGYVARAPGTYTVTVVSALDQATLILNQVVTMNPSTAISVYVVDGNASAITVDQG